VTVWRWHFLRRTALHPLRWLAATGSIYLFKPQIDAWLDRPYRHLEIQGAPRSPSMQVAAALAAVPGGG
jgi:uncharacterized iron-regulated membrane protein